ncbi:MAG: Gfo/Idh/MocA family oxidoreductase [Clostridiales bacterium]|jgi:predicted dehydrogenase|nr:Gfo/Idh/MocA family oxidoreductase [Clostridiales bacterium]
MTYVFAGASSRGLNSFALPLRESYSGTSQILGIFDINLGRAEYMAARCGNPPVYADFGEMLRATKPDTVIVTTVDAYHSEYIVQALESGCDVITEKPMTIDAGKCRAILAAERKSGRKVTVTFNYRYAPYASKIKELVMSGAVGDVYSVHFEWLLDKIMAFGAHGTSYFRRWNSRMAKSGGLLVHKSTHHFDLINWWLGATPDRVSAFGRLREYGAANAPYQGKNCRSCGHARECRFRYELTDFEKAFYEGNERHDGYFKDGCVFSDEIDIYDTMAVNVSYREGPVLSYSLNATTPYEGWRAAINGSRGRLEAFLPETGFQANAGQANSIKVFDLKDNVSEYSITKVNGAHGGGDERMLGMLFGGAADDPLGYAAGTRAGANSILIGAAANISIRESRIVPIGELLGEESME